MKIAIPQLNYVIGDIDGNQKKIISAIRQAGKEKAELVVFPELAVCGAYPLDLLEREYFVNACRMAIEAIAEQCKGVAALVGCPNYDFEEGVLYNAMFLMYDGEVRGGVNKTILSDYDVFDESRYFVGGDENIALLYKKEKIRIIFDEYEMENIRPEDSLIIHVGAVPFTRESYKYRQETFSAIAARHKRPLISLNHVGANTSLIFDGNAMVFDARGELKARASAFAEDLLIVDTALAQPQAKPREIREIPLIHEALLLGIRDYFRKHNFKQAVLGLSGGIDSAVVATLLAEALGAEHVLGVLMPSPFSSDHSVSDALELARIQGIQHTTLPIEQVYHAFTSTLQPLFKDLPFNVAEENLQARARGILLMALSNKFGHILINSSNKSEAAVGYGTLYGDLCGSLSVIGDLYKTEVFALAEYLNRNGEIIPRHIITKPPSAELRPGQIDQDSLPDYPTLDAILKAYLEENLSPQEIKARGYAAETVDKVLRLVNSSEYKRALFPPILKVSSKAFGRGRRMPF